MKLTLTSTLLLFTFFCYAQTDTTKTSFIKDNYKIQFPENWRLDTSRFMGTEFYIFSPLENDTDKFSENVNGLIQDLGTQNINIEKYKEITDKQFAEMAPDCNVLESSIIKTNEKEYFKTTYSMTQSIFRLKITSICFIKNSKAYLVTFSAEFDKYEQYKKVGEEIINSFLFTK